MVQFQEEKVEREREILKLKQQCKLIDKFTKGPQAYMSEIKVSRRHTVGHYGHRLALDPIPELTVAPSTSSGAGAGSRPETSSTASTQETYEEFLKLEDTSDSVLAEPIDDSSSSARTPSPEPAQYEHLQEEETPPSLLRKRLRSLEHSFTSLREFTRLEQECKEQEQEDSTQELVRQKERLMKDCSDLDAMLQSERQEKEILKLTYADNEASLKASIEELKEENTNLASKLAQIEAESEIIKVARGNELTDHQYELEERTRNYDQQLNHLRDEIQRLRNQTPEVEPLQQRITELVDENRHLTDAVIGKNQKIEQLVDQLSKKEECIVEGATEDILSISTQTENIETEADKDRDRTEEETARLQHETEVGSLVEKIKQLELDNELKAEKEQKLQAQLNEAHNVIKKLNEEIALEMEHSAFLNEERDIFLQEVAILTELLSLDDEQIVLGLIEEHQGLLDLYESLLKSYSDQIIIGYTSELDQFTICLQELDNITTDVFLKEKIETAFINIDSSPANFIFLLEEFSRTVSNAKYSEIMKKLNKLKADIKQKTNHVMYKELRNKQLQLKIGKQMQYLEQLDDLKVRIRSEKDKDQMTKTLEDKVKEYEKRIVELESTLDGVKHECAALIIDLEERGKEVDEGAKTSDADLQKIIDLTDETVSLRSQLVDLRSERDELTDQLKRLKKSIKGAKVELETEKAKNQELNTKLENLQSENIVSEKDKDQMIKTLEGKVKEYEKRIVELESTLDSVKLECAALRIDLEEREKEGDEGAKTSDADLQKIIDLTDETVSLRSQLVDLRSERDELTDQLKRLKKSIKGAKVELEAEKAKNQELNIKLENLQSEKIGNEKDKDQMITTLEDKVKEYEKRIVELESTLDSVKHECAVLKIDLEEREKEGGEDVKTSDADLQKIIDLTNETVSLRSQLVDLRSECDGLTDQLKRFKKSIKGTKVELETEKAKIQELNGKLENLQSENVSLIIKNCDLENQLKDMKSQGGYGLWKFSTATFTDEYVKDPTEGNAALQKEFDEMRSTILDLCTERDHLNVEITSLRGSLTQIQNESISEKENKNSDLNKKLKDLYLENMALTTRINDLENTVKVTRSTESLESRRSSSSSELSQKEIRRRKRQSLQDQRRGIDLEECGDGLPEDGQDIVEKELKEKIDKLTEKVTKLANDNNFLEDEIQGFIVELADARRYNSERLTEIQKLKEELEQSKRDAKKKEVSCDKCDSMENYIKRLEDLHKSCMYKKVDLQTQIYDLQNIAEIEKCNRGEVERKLRYENHRLKEKLGIDQPPEMEDSETQCNFLEYDALIAKYNNLKKVAKMRRTEGNILRGRLGMQPDEPVE